MFGLEHRSYIMTDEGLSIAEAARLDLVLDVYFKQDQNELYRPSYSFSDHAEVWNEMWSEVKGLPQYTPDDTKKIHDFYTLLHKAGQARKLPNTPWNILPEEGDSISVKIDSIPDAVVVTGVEAALIGHNAPEVVAHIQERIASPLGAMAFLGAYMQGYRGALFGRHSADNAPNKVMDVSATGAKIVEFGADPHGDFKIFSKTTYNSKSITPLGDEVPFSPVETHHPIAGYHSCESSIVTDIMKYLAQSGLSVNQQAELLQSVRETIVQSGEVQQKGGDFFADFDTDSIVDMMVTAGLDRMPTIAPQAEGVQYLSRLTVAPGRDDVCLAVLIDENNQLVIKNEWRSDDEWESNGNEVIITSENAEKMLTALIFGAAHGRTGTCGLLAMVEKRLATLQQP